MTRLLLLLAATAALMPLLTARVWGADSDAPPGAPEDWLPQEEWVMERLSPFDEARLHAVLRADRPTVGRWLRDDTRTLEQLARRRGVSTRGLATRLVAPRRGEVSRRRYVELRSRAARMLDQGHLAQHVLGHQFHLWTIPRSAPSLFGVSTREFRRLRGQEGLTPGEVAARSGIEAPVLERRILAAARATGDRGVRTDQLSRRQAAERMRRLEDRVGVWVRENRLPARPAGRAASASASRICHLPG